MKQAVRPETVTLALARVLECLDDCAATDWRPWFQNALERARGLQSPGIELFEIQRVAQLNYVPVLRHLFNTLPNVQALPRKLADSFQSLITSTEPDWPLEVYGFLRLGDAQDRTRIMGDLYGAETVAESATDLTTRFCNLIVSGQISETYEMASVGLQERQSLRAYIAAINKSFLKLGGTPIAYTLNQVPFVYTLGIRPSQRWERKWPGFVSENEKAAIVDVYFTTNSQANAGFSSSIWWTGDCPHLRIAKLQHDVD